MKLLKRIVIFLLIVIPLTIHILQTRPLCSEANIHKVDGVVSDAYVVKLRGNTSSFSCILIWVIIIRIRKIQVETFKIKEIILKHIAHLGKLNL